MFRHSLGFVCLLAVGVSATPTAAQHSAAKTSLATSDQFAQDACTETLFVISGSTESDRKFACSGARQAAALLGRCGVSLKRPMRLEISEQINHPFGRPVLGFFDVTQEKVLVRSSHNVSAIASKTPFAAVTLPEFYASIVAHEVVHGILHQNSQTHVLSHTAGEYLAYALQIDSLPANARRAFLHSFPTGGSTADLLFSDLMLSLDPYLFAARAYEHFSIFQDRCGLVKALLKGDVSFIVATY